MNGIKLFITMLIAVVITIIVTISIILSIEHIGNYDKVEYAYKIDNSEESPDTIVISTQNICTDTANIESILPILHIDTINFATYKDPKIVGFF